MTCDRFKFRPSEAAGITGTTPAFMFDLLAAVVVTEFEADSYRSSTGKSDEMSFDMKRRAEERFQKQELIAKKQTKEVNNVG